MHPTVQLACFLMSIIFIIFTTTTQALNTGAESLERLHPPRGVLPKQPKVHVTSENNIDEFRSNNKNNDNESYIKANKKNRRQLTEATIDGHKQTNDQYTVSEQPIINETSDKQLETNFRSLVEQYLQPPSYQHHQLIDPHNVVRPDNNDENNNEKLNSLLASNWFGVKNVNNDIINSSFVDLEKISASRNQQHGQQQLDRLDEFGQSIVASWPQIDQQQARSKNNNYNTNNELAPNHKYKFNYSAESNENSYPSLGTSVDFRTSWSNLNSYYNNFNLSSDVIEPSQDSNTSGSQGSPSFAPLGLVDSSSSSSHNEEASSSTKDDKSEFNESGLDQLGDLLVGLQSTATTSATTTTKAEATKAPTLGVTDNSGVRFKYLYSSRGPIMDHPLDSESGSSGLSGSSGSDLGGQQASGAGKSLTLAQSLDLMRQLTAARVGAESLAARAHLPVQGSSSAATTMTRDNIHGATSISDSVPAAIDCPLHGKAAHHIKLVGSSLPARSFRIGQATKSPEQPPPTNETSMPPTLPPSAPLNATSTIASSLRGSLAARLSEQRARNQQIWQKRRDNNNNNNNAPANNAIAKFVAMTSPVAAAQTSTTVLIPDEGGLMRADSTLAATPQTSTIFPAAYNARHHHHHHQHVHSIKQAVFPLQIPFQLPTSAPAKALNYDSLVAAAAAAAAAAATASATRVARVGQQQQQQQMRANVLRGQLAASSTSNSPRHAYMAAPADDEVASVLPSPPLLPIGGRLERFRGMSLDDYQHLAAHFKPQHRTRPAAPLVVRRQPSSFFSRFMRRLLGRGADSSRGGLWWRPASDRSQPELVAAHHRSRLALPQPPPARAPYVTPLPAAPIANGSTASIKQQQQSRGPGESGELLSIEPTDGGGTSGDLITLSQPMDLYPKQTNPNEFEASLVRYSPSVLESSGEHPLAHSPPALFDDSGKDLDLFATSGEDEPATRPTSPQSANNYFAYSNSSSDTNNLSQSVQTGSDSAANGNWIGKGSSTTTTTTTNNNNKNGDLMRGRRPVRPFNTRHVQLVRLVPDPHVQYALGAAQFESPATFTSAYTTAGSELLATHWRPSVNSAVAQLPELLVAGRTRDLATAESAARLAVASRAGLVHLFWPLLALFVPVMIAIAIVAQLVMAAPLTLFALTTLTAARFTGSLLRPFDRSADGSGLEARKLLNSSKFNELIDGVLNKYNISSEKNHSKLKAATNLRPKKRRKR